MPDHEFSYTQGIDSRTKLYDSPPAIYINKIVFTSTDPEWYHRLFDCMGTVELYGLDQNDKKAKFNGYPLTFSNFVAGNQKELVFPVHQFFKYSNSPHMNVNTNEIVKWGVTISIRDIELRENEVIDIHFLDAESISDRIENWKTRICDVYNKVKEWSVEKGPYKLTPGSPVVMYEELQQIFDLKAVEIDTAILVLGKERILNLVPKGLWLIGANGAIDIISSKGSYTLVDLAEPMKDPVWALFAKTPNAKPKAFKKEELLNIL